MMLARTTLLALLCALAPATSLASEPGPEFAWIDGAGSLQTARELRLVPEPFYSAYLAQKDAVARAERAAAYAGVNVAAPPSQAALVPQAFPAAQGAAARQSDARMAWKVRAAQARGRLLEATLTWQRAQGELARARQNPLLNFTPVTKANIEAVAARVVQARSAALAAREALLVQLPQQAREAHVPPQWLLP